MDKNEAAFDGRIDESERCESVTGGFAFIIPSVFGGVGILPHPWLRRTFFGGFRGGDEPDVEHAFCQSDRAAG
jgi:hypothetical protein